MSISRIIDLNGPIIPYNSEVLDEKLSTKKNNCHWGQLKLLFSEIEFLTLCSEYFDVNECLIVYVGAGSGGDERIKNLFMKEFYPNVSMLLYDPTPFTITENENIIIRTGEAGFFTDSKVEEVLKIANGRKILYLSDIRLSDENKAVKESLIYDNMVEQQRWGIMMGAEMMCLKFRMFFYRERPEENTFIDNADIIDEIKDHVIYEKDMKKHKSVHNYLIYLSGTIYSQIYAGLRSTETRLFVKKAKYHTKDEDYGKELVKGLSKEEKEKYFLNYYDNVNYEGILNYFNLKTRQNEYEISKSQRAMEMIPGLDNSYSSVSSYYILGSYLKSIGRPVTVENIVNLYILIYSYLNEKFNNNLIMCQMKNMRYLYSDLKKDIQSLYISKNIDRFSKQFELLIKYKKIYENPELIDRLIKTFNTKEKAYNIEDGVITKKFDKVDEGKIMREYAKFITIQKKKEEKKLL